MRFKEPAAQAADSHPHSASPRLALAAADAEHGPCAHSTNFTHAYGLIQVTNTPSHDTEQWPSAHTIAHTPTAPNPPKRVTSSTANSFAIPASLIHSASASSSAAFCAAASAAAASSTAFLPSLMACALMYPCNALVYVLNEQIGSQTICYEAINLMLPPQPMLPPPLLSCPP